MGASEYGSILVRFHLRQYCLVGDTSRLSSAATPKTYSNGLGIDFFASFRYIESMILSICLVTIGLIALVESLRLLWLGQNWAQSIALTLVTIAGELTVLRGIGLL